MPTLVADAEHGRAQFCPDSVRDTSAVSAQLTSVITLDTALYFCKYRNMSVAHSGKSIEQVAKYADMFSAMGTEPRLRIMQLLLSAHPEGLVVGEIQQELDIPNSTLSHHLDKLKAEGLVHVRRVSTYSLEKSKTTIHLGLREV